MTPPIGRTQSVGLQLFAPLLPVGKAFVSLGPEFVELEMALVFIIALSFESVFNNSLDNKLSKKSKEQHHIINLF